MYLDKRKTPIHYHLGTCLIQFPRTPFLPTLNHDAFNDLPQTDVVIKGVKRT